MRKIFFLLLFILFAMSLFSAPTATPTPAYKQVEFETGTKTYSGGLCADIPQSVLNLLKGAYSVKIDGKKAYVFGMAEVAVDFEKAIKDYKLKSVSILDKAKYDTTIKNIEERLKYKNKTDVDPYDKIFEANR